MHFYRTLSLNIHIYNRSRGLGNTNIYLRDLCKRVSMRDFCMQNSTIRSILKSTKIESQTDAQEKRLFSEVDVFQERLTTYISRQSFYE